MENEPKVGDLVRTTNYPCGDVVGKMERDPSFCDEKNVVGVVTEITLHIGVPIVYLDNHLYYYPEDLELIERRKDNE